MKSHLRRRHIHVFSSLPFSVIPQAACHDLYRVNNTSKNGNMELALPLCHDQINQFGVPVPHQEHKHRFKGNKTTDSESGTSAALQRLPVIASPRCSRLVLIASARHIDNLTVTQKCCYNFKDTSIHLISGSIHLTYRLTDCLGIDLKL